MSRFTRVAVFDWMSFETSMGNVLARVDSVLSEDVRFLRDFARL